MKGFKILIILFCISSSIIYANTYRQDSLIISMGLKPHDFTFENIDGKTVLVNHVDTIKYFIKMNYVNTDFVVKFRNVVFLKRFNITHSTFNENLYFDNVILDEPLVITNSNFNKVLSFKNCFFSKEFHLIKDTIYNFGLFESSTLDQILISGSIFQSDVYWAGDSIESIWLTDIVSNKIFQIIGTDFKSFCLITNSRFDELLFGSSTFSREFDFNETEISKLRISKSGFESLFNWYQTYLPDTLEVIHSNFSNELDFSYSECKNNKKCLLFIDNTKLENIIFNNGIKFFFPENISSKQKNKIYNNLLNSLKSKGENNLYQDTYIDYKFFLLKEGSLNFFSKLDVIISYYWWEFGFKKQRILYISFLFIFILALIFHHKLLIVLKHYDIKELNEKYQNTQEIKTLKIIIHKFIIAFIYFSFLFFNFKIDLKELKFNNLGWTSFIIFIYVFGKICTAYIINLIITV